MYKIAKLFDEASVPVDGDLNVDFVSPSYFEALISLLDETPSRVIGELRKKMRIFIIINDISKIVTQNIYVSELYTLEFCEPSNKDYHQRNERLGRFTEKHISKNKR